MSTAEAGPKRVLVVEDNPADADLLRISLAEAGNEFVVEHVTRVSSAVMYLLRGTADVILLDLGLPDAQGLDALAQMRAAAKGIPIVVLTGLADGRTGIAAIEQGAQDYVVKGWVEGGAVLTRVRRAIERGRVRHELADVTSSIKNAQERLRKLGIDKGRGD